MADIVYCYPNSDVLVNKLGITELEKLHIIERKLTMLRLLELIDNPVKDKFLSDLSRKEFVEKIAYYFAEINAIHPFREGNGRAQREFIRALALKNGYVIRFAEVSEDEMIRASQESFLCKYDAIENLFDKCIRKVK